MQLNTLETNKTPAMQPVRDFFKPLITHEGIGYYLEEINPLWSPTDLRARVLDVIDETHDTKTFVLKVNHHWKGFTAGQNIGVNVEIDGVTHRRRYSMSCMQQAARRFSITVKRVADGRVSNWLHDNVKAGDVLNLGAVAGDFVLPAELPDRLLMMAAGSGITPLMSQLETLLANGYYGDIVFMNYVRSPGDHIFGERLARLAERHDNLSVIWCEESSDERFSADQIARHVPDYQERHSMLCGPAGFMAAVREHWQGSELNDQLQFEYFGTPPIVRDANDENAEVDVTLSGKAREVTSKGSQSLLEALEEAGETPVYGCRMGICHECKCRKTSGVVRNALTGELSSDSDEDIQLCISVAESDVVLDY